MKNLFKKSKLISIFLLLTVFSGSVTFADRTKNPECTDAAKKLDLDFWVYCDNVESFCSAYDTTTSWDNLIKVAMIPFLPMNTPDYVKYKTEQNGNEFNDAKWFDKLQKFLWNFYNSNLTATTPFEQAKFIYTETQNAVLNCAVIRSKMKIWEVVISEITKSNKNSNLIAKIKSQNKSLQSELDKRKCWKEWVTKTTSYKQILLDNMTFHYCNYRYYLNYLSNYPEYNIDTNRPVSSKVMSPSQARDKAAKRSQIEARGVTKMLKKQMDVIAKESAHAKQVYNQSIAAFTEMENTYGLHIMLLFIYDDYIKIRDNLWKILNPVSQLAYKIPQCQSQK